MSRWKCSVSGSECDVCFEHQTSHRPPGKLGRVAFIITITTLHHGSNTEWMHPQTPKCVSWGLKELREAQVWYTAAIDIIANIKSAVVFLSYIVREAQGFPILIEKPHGEDPSLLGF